MEKEQKEVINNLQNEFYDLCQKYNTKLYSKDFIEAITILAADLAFEMAPSKEEALKVLKNGIKLGMKYNKELKE